MNRRKKLLIVGLSAIVIAIAVALCMVRGGVFSSVPTVTVETPQKISASDREPFSQELQLSSMSSGIYPAASFSISFDPSKLEFLGIDEGNVPVLSSTSSSGAKLPEWVVNTERSNDTGIINIIYLDMTGGGSAFSGELLADEDNVLLMLNFRLRGSARQGDILELGLNDAVFAAVDETESLSCSAETLRTVSGRIVIGN